MNNVKKYGNSPLRGQSRNPLNIPIALFAILAIISFAFSIYKHDSFYSLVRLFAYIGLYYLIVCEFDHKMMKHLIWVTIFVGGSLSLYGILQYLGIFDRSWWRPQEFLASTYVNHNHFAGYLELVMPVAATILIYRSGESRMINRVMLVLALIIMFTAFIFTQSRGAWISLLISALIAIFFIARPGVKGLNKLFIAILAIVSIASLLYLNRDVISSRIGAIDTIDSVVDSSGGRFKIWGAAMGMIFDKPLVGVGVGDFDHGFYRFRPEGLNGRAVYAHNDYLQATSEMGIFAPILIIWIFFITVITGLKNRSNPYAMGCAIGIMSLALHGLVDFNFHIPANMVLFTVWMGIVMKESNAKRT